MNLIIPGEPDDPMVGLDPWTAGYIRLRKLVESGGTERDVEDLALTIRRTLPSPAPPPVIDAVLRADLAMLEMNAGVPLDPEKGNVAAYLRGLLAPQPGEEGVSIC